VPLCLCVVVLLLWFFVCVVLCPCCVLSLCGCRCALCVLWFVHLLVVCIAAILVEGPPIGGKSWVVQPFAFDFACALCLCVCVCLGVIVRSVACSCPPCKAQRAGHRLQKAKTYAPKLPSIYQEWWLVFGLPVCRCFGCLGSLACLGCLACLGGLSWFPCRGWLPSRFHLSPSSPVCLVVSVVLLVLVASAVSMSGCLCLCLWLGCVPVPVLVPVLVLVPVPCACVAFAFVSVQRSSPQLGVTYFPPFLSACRVCMSSLHLVGLWQRPRNISNTWAAGRTQFHTHI
jgi:hypothetical protein